MKNMSVARTGRALLVASIFFALSGCDDNGNPLDTSGVIKPGSLAAKQIAEDHQAAINAETISIEHLAHTANEPETEEQRLVAEKLTLRHQIRLGRLSGDYSFSPPPATPRSRPNQLLNLPAVSAPRFTVTDRDWPATFGEMSVAMWSQDKLAAFSLTIDDNHVRDHAFWYEMAEQYGWKWTWFVIANQVGWASHDHWGHWQEAVDKGHDIQTHTYSHLCDALFYTSREYRQSQAVINQNLDGAEVVTMAYPFGVNTNKNGSPCVSLDTSRTANDRDEAAKHFLAARDVYGALSHPARLDFMKVPSVSSARNFFDASRPWAYFDSVFDASSNNWRTWYSAHFHGLYNEAQKQGVRDVLAHVKTREDDVWVGTFTQIAKYAQQYASSEFSGIQITANSLRFELKDEMNDQWFNEPLTVKVRLPDGWSGLSVNATQSGAALPAQAIQHDGAYYALVDVVPDRGVVDLSF